MKIVSRFKLRDGSNGYSIEDDGIMQTATERGLYEYSILVGLVDAGYKVMDYHGNIITPDGIAIQEIIESPCTASSSEIDMAYELADTALTEAEATQYFCREVHVQTVELKEPKVEINTREELIVYLENWVRVSRLKSSTIDIRPLNSFVAHDALFDVSEIITDSAVKRYFDIIESRRNLASYQDYERLIAFLQAEGVLGTTYSASDIKKAYLSWGICGIKTSITNIKEMVGVTADIYSMVEAVDNHDPLVGRRVRVGILDRQGIMHYDGKTLDMHDLNGDYKNCDASPMDENKFLDKLRSTTTWTCDFMPVEISTPVPKTRTYIQLIDESGISYQAKVDTNKLVIMDSRSIVLVSSFIYVRSIDGRSIELEKCINKDDFIVWALAKAKVRDIVASKTINAPVSSTYEMCIKEGVSPENAVAWCARRIQQDPGLNRNFSTGVDYSDAAITYRKGPKENYIAKYNPDGIETESLDELIEVMKSTRDAMVDSGEYLVASDKDYSAAASAIRQELVDRPVEKLEFVKAIKDGEFSVDYFAAGKSKDGTIEEYKLAGFLLQAIEVLNPGRKLGVEEIKNILQNIENDPRIAMDEVFRDRDAAYYGYLRDRAELNAARAKECSRAVYITRVYREIANVPTEEQRHYLFDCVALDLKNKTAPNAIAMQQITKAIEKAIDDLGLDYTKKIIYKTEAPSIALKLMFKILSSQETTVGETFGGVMVTEKLKVAGEIKELSINIPKTAYERAKNPASYYIGQSCTLYDWCFMELTGGAWNFYCVNANINPWFVTPKPGFKINCYSYYINWFSNEFMSRTPQSFRDKVAVSGGRVREFIKDWRATEFIEGSESISNLYNEYNIDTLLDVNVDEYQELYVKRFELHNNKAKADGEFVRRVPLKSDIVYKNYADACGVTITETVDRAPKDGDSEFLCTGTYDVLTLSDKVNMDAPALEANKFGAFNFKDQKYCDIIGWTGLINDTFKPRAECMIFGPILICVSPRAKVEKDLSKITKEELLKLADKEVCYQLNARKFLFLTTNGNYYVEVRQ